MFKNKNNRIGFTIVELMVVVIVIGILAAITTVAYNGVQRQAENTKVLASVTNWETIIRLYQIKSLRLPDDWTCLGQSPDDFPADPEYSLGDRVCERGMIVNDTWSSEYKITKPTPTSPQDLPTPELLRQQASPGSGAMKPLTDGTKIIKGIIYAAIADPNQVPHPGAYLIYALDSQECPSGEEFKTQGSINVCARLLTDPTASWAEAIDLP